MTRRDNKGRVLQKGETYQEKFDRYRYTYTDVLGKRHSVFSDTLKELRVREEEIMKKYYLGIDLRNPRITLNEVFEMCMATKQNLRLASRLKYFDMYNRFIRIALGNRAMSSIKYDDIQRLYLKLYSDGMSYKYLCSVHMLMRMCFKRAMFNDYILKDPTDGALSEFKVKNDIDASYKKRPALTLDQTRIFLNALQNRHEAKWKNMFITLFGTGLRISEAQGLRWDDINFDDGYITVDHQLIYRFDGERYRFQISPPKSFAGYRLIPLIDEVREALLEEKKINERLHIECKLNVDGYTNFVFLNSRGTTRSTQQINEMIHLTVENYNERETEAAQKEGRNPVLLPQFSAHTTRHTFCTRLCESKVQGPVTQKIMGHARFATTMDIYTEVSEASKKHELDALRGRII